MKRQIIIIALLCVAQIVVAQNAIPLISALKTIEQRQSEYTINIESNGQGRTSLSAIMKLPWKLDLSTDLSLYTRTGYADEALNTNDLVWNARLTRPFLKGRLLMIFDGFDILGQLSNVTRTLNAQGRTETYTNVMPRYALLHIVYRLNKKPKSKVSK